MRRSLSAVVGRAAMVGTAAVLARHVPAHRVVLVHVAAAAPRQSARWVSTAPRHAAKRDPYEVLGLPPGASTEQVKVAYYKLAMEMHPDRNSAPDAVDRFAELGQAYDDLMGTPSSTAASAAAGASGDEEVPQHTAVPVTAAFPPWAYRVFEYLNRVPQRFDQWLAPSYSSLIYQHLKDNELAEALALFEEMRLEGERPTHAVYEMLIRGCTIAMRRPKIGARPDHLTVNLVHKVLELWGDMRDMGRQPDYLTHIELIRALGKGGALPQALNIFEAMCAKVTLLPEERAFNSMYEACVLSGAYKEALAIFDEQEEMRKSLWKPRFTPVSFSLLLTATAELGPHAAERVAYLPRVLDQMGGYGILPRAETCDRLLAACVRTGEIGIGERVLAVAKRAGHTLEPKGIAAYEKRKRMSAGSSSSGDKPRPRVGS